MTLRELQDVLVARGGLRLRLARRKADQLIGFAVDCWPANAEQLTPDFIEDALKLGVFNRYRESGGASVATMGPVALWLLEALIGLIVHLLVAWWTEDRANRQRSLLSLRTGLRVT